MHFSTQRVNPKEPGHRASGSFTNDLLWVTAASPLWRYDLRKRHCKEILLPTGHGRRCSPRSLSKYVRKLDSLKKSKCYQTATFIAAFSFPSWLTQTAPISMVATHTIGTITWLRAVFAKVARSAFYKIAEMI